MVPFEATFLPVYLLFANLKLHNTLIALILPGIASSFAVFLLTQFFRGIPLELEEAAMMDGAGRFRIFLTIILPLSTPVITALSIFTFLGNWNSLSLADYFGDHARRLYHRHRLAQNIAGMGIRRILWTQHGGSSLYRLAYHSIFFFLVPTPHH